MEILSWMVNNTRVVIEKYQSCVRCDVIFSDNARLTVYAKDEFSALDKALKYLSTMDEEKKGEQQK